MWGGHNWNKNLYPWAVVVITLVTCQGACENTWCHRVLSGIISRSLADKRWTVLWRGPQRNRPERISVQLGMVTVVLRDYGGLAGEAGRMGTQGKAKDLVHQ